MYIWLVLSTFLAILAGYSLPLRSDASDSVDVPVATANAMRMVIDHKVVLQHLRTQKWPYKCTQPGYVAGNECEISNQTDFAPGVVNFATIDFGDFKPDYNYTSQVFCYDQDGTPNTTKCYRETSNNRKRYLVTYGALHNKWLSYESDTECAPDANVLRGIGKHYSPDTLIGYVKFNGTAAELISPIGLKLYDFKDDMNVEMVGRCTGNCNGSCIAFVNEL